jgi:very-short-patch-repair endonuclease
MSEKKTLISRKLRNNSTEAEKKLWYFLRSYRKQGIKFRRQQPIGFYYPDFVCLEKKLVVELDGGQHFQSKSDKIRDAWFKKEGFTVLRFWDNEVFENIEAVVEKILSYCK